MKTPVSLTDTAHRYHESNTPTAMLRQEHEMILRALALLERIGHRFEAGEPVDRIALASLRDFFGTFADKCHHGKEEQHLFPAIERHGIPQDGGPLGVMLREHEDGRALIRVIGAGDDRRTAEAIRSYVRLLRDHIDKENEVLFPLAEQVLPEEEQRELKHAFDVLEETLAGPGGHDRLMAELTRLEAGSL